MVSAGRMKTVMIDAANVTTVHTVPTDDPVYAVGGRTWVGIRGGSGPVVLTADPEVVWQTVLTHRPTP